MKTLKITVAFGIVISLYAFASCTEVPEKVKEAFHARFPKIITVHWEKESNVEWEAEFRMDNMNYSANFMEDGTWVETEHEITIQDISEHIQLVMKNTFPTYKLQNIEISETKDGRFYEFEILLKGNYLEILMDMDGEILKKEILTEKDK